MKTISKFQVLLLMLSLATTVPSFANNNDKEKAPITNTAEENAKVEVMINRIKEIKDMDKSNLTRSEKKELRNEVKTIKKSLSASGNGVYLSVGAIIIIILVLILIL